MSHSAQGFSFCNDAKTRREQSNDEEMMDRNEQAISHGIADKQLVSLVSGSTPSRHK
jgi:hypothetical protein